MSFRSIVAMFVASMASTQAQGVAAAVSALKVSGLAACGLVGIGAAAIGGALSLTGNIAGNLATDALKGFLDARGAKEGLQVEKAVIRALVECLEEAPEIVLTGEAALLPDLGLPELRQLWASRLRVAERDAAKAALLFSHPQAPEITDDQAAALLVDDDDTAAQALFLESLWPVLRDWGRQAYTDHWHPSWDGTDGAPCRAVFDGFFATFRRRMSTQMTQDRYRQLWIKVQTSLLLGISEAVRKQGDATQETLEELRSYELMAREREEAVWLMFAQIAERLEAVSGGEVPLTVARLDEQQREELGKEVDSVREAVVHGTRWLEAYRSRDLNRQRLLDADFRPQGDRLYGREEDVRTAMARIEGAGGERLLLTAPAGVGKTAFLARLAREAGAQGWAVAEHYFSIRFDERSSQALWGALALQLGRYLGEEGQQFQQWPTYENAGEDMLTRLIESWPKGRRAVVFVDGLDEADEVPNVRRMQALRNLPQEFTVVASYRAESDPRHLPDSVRLWSSASVADLTLSPLKWEGIRDWLTFSDDGQLARYATAEFCRALAGASESLPVFLVYLVEDLHGHVAAGRAPAIASLPHGLSGYLKEVIEELQSQQVGAVVLKAFWYLSVALGPVPDGTMARWMGLELPFDDLDAAAPVAKRWWRRIEDEASSSFSFAHPRLAVAFAESDQNKSEGARARIVHDLLSADFLSDPYALRYGVSQLLEAFEKGEGPEARWKAAAASFGIGREAIADKAVAALTSLDYVDRKSREGLVTDLANELAEARRLLG